MQYYRCECKSNCGIIGRLVKSQPDPTWKDWLLGRTPTFSPTDVVYLITEDNTRVVCFYGCLRLISTSEYVAYKLME